MGGKETQTQKVYRHKKSIEFPRAEMGGERYSKQKKHHIKRHGDDK